MMCHMERQWTRLGAAYKRVRRARRITQEEAADAIGVSRALLQKLEQGHEYVRGATSAHYEYARWLGWTRDSVDAVLAGGDPTPADTPPQPAEGATATLDDLSVAVRHALSQGVLVDSETFEIPTAGGTLTATIVVRGAPDRSLEELHDGLLELRRKGVLRAPEEDQPSDTSK
jgi:DNA-binding XRE family transcriptional regulator